MKPSVWCAENLVLLAPYSLDPTYVVLSAAIARSQSFLSLSSHSCRAHPRKCPASCMGFSSGFHSFHSDAWVSAGSQLSRRISGSSPVKRSTGGAFPYSGLLCPPPPENGVNLVWSWPDRTVTENSEPKWFDKLIVILAVLGTSNSAASTHPCEEVLPMTDVIVATLCLGSVTWGVYWNGTTVPRLTTLNQF